MNLFRREEPPFLPNAAQYAGSYRGATPDGLKCWEVIDPRQEPFKDILDAACLVVSRCRAIPRSTLVLLDVFLRGKDLNSCTPYLMLSGASQRHRKAAIKHLRRSSLTQEYPGLKLDHWDWPPHVPDITMAGREGKAVDKNLLYQCSKFEIHQLLSGFGLEGGSTEILSITATSDGDGAIPQSGVLSCAVVVGQERFFLVPAHIFMPPPADDPGEDFDGDSDGSESDDGSEMLRAGSATPPTEHLADSDYTTDDTRQLSPAISPDTPQSGVEEWRSTQLPSATDEFSVFASELDYALVQIPHHEKLHEKLHCLSKKTVQQIRTGRFAISTITPSCGLIEGWLDGRPTMMRLPYGSRFTSLYPISFPCAVSKGDCGSLVIDKDTKKVYGFIAAASVEGRVAYMVSADEILQDMSMKLGKEVSDHQRLSGITAALSGITAAIADYLTPPMSALSIHERGEAADRPSSAVSLLTVSVSDQPPSTTSEHTVSVSSTIDQPPSTMSEHTLLGAAPQPNMETASVTSPTAKRRRTSITSEHTFLASHGETTLVPSAADAMSVRTVGTALQFNLDEVLSKDDVSVEKQAMVSDWAESVLKAPWQGNVDPLHMLESGPDGEGRLEAGARYLSRECQALKKELSQLQRQKVVLKDFLQDRAQECSVLRRELERLRRENLDLKHDKQDSSQKYEALRRELHLLRRENAALARNTQDGEALRGSVRGGSFLVSAADHQFEIENLRLKEENIRLKAQFRDDEFRRAGAEESHLRSANVTAKLREENERLMSVNNALRASNAQSRDEASGLTGEVLAVHRRYDEMNRRFIRLRENLDESLVANKDLRLDNDRLRARNEWLMTEGRDRSDRDRDRDVEIRVSRR
ncbi:hypothetical protein B0H67DRAFT_580813 [Lasiosphaeris hirsuta]|uniref:Uncharacterized protein n=1 Tax=Lasiosphaeris hirsuta TaxID=260670 RepID=A0AA40AGM3_9PEZI|nr:hypothetical protein B0H67DRAFT_580813 [Lasiosphaeris hirsuta]